MEEFFAMLIDSFLQKQDALPTVELRAFRRDQDFNIRTVGLGYVVIIRTTFPR